MMKRRYFSAWICLMVAWGVVVIGCGGPSLTTAGPAPPPPPSTGPEPVEVFDYSHSIHHAGDAKLTRKFVVALVRFAEDRPIDDVPYGTESKPEAPAGTTVMDVDVQVGGQRPVNPAKTPAMMGSRAREMLKHELMESDSFVMVERERILDILREQKFGETRYVNPDTSPELGEVIAVQYLLEGSIGPNEDRTLKDTLPPPPSYANGEPSLAERILNPGKASARRRLKELSRLRRQQAIRQQKRQENPVGAYLSMYDVRTSEIVAEAFGIGGNSLEAIRDCVDELVNECLEIPNPIRIAAVDDDRVYLDIGTEDSISIGDRLRYLTPGPPVRNNAGQVIGSRDEEGGELEIIRVDRFMSVARVTQRVAAPVVGGRVETIE